MLPKVAEYSNLGLIAATPLGLPLSLAAAPRVAEYGNPGLADGSPSGN